MTISPIIDAVLNRPYQEYQLEEPIEIDELPTPALVVNLPKFESNLIKMASFSRSAEKGVRPHAKTHKCPIICKKQIDHGAVGVCVAKVSEALSMANAGVGSILITSPVTTKAKASVLDLVASRVENLATVVDSAKGLEVLQAQLDFSRSVGVLVDIDVEMGRTGTRDVDTVLRIIEEIDADERLVFKGLQHYAGHLMHIASFSERKEKSLALWDKVDDLVTVLDSKEISCDIVTGGGTGTYNIDCEVDRLTDLQVGSYIFMDQEYRIIASKEADHFEDFDVSLTVACTAISQPWKGAITVDGGYKSFASETVEPVAVDLPGTRFKFAGDEHGVLLLQKGEQELSLGSVRQFVTPHCDPTVNLHDNYWIQKEDGLIHSIWPVSARGCSW